MTENQNAMAEFERARGQLAGISAQKRNMQAQISMLDATNEELGKTKEKKVYKAVGNILVPAETKTVIKDVKKQKETIDLRIKTVQKQEDALMEKLNKLKTEIEGKDKNEKA